MIPLVVSWFFKPQYAESAAVLQILLAGSMFNLYGIFYDPIFDTLKQFRFLQSAIVFALLINLGLDFILVSRMGYIGAAYATSITYLILTLIKEFYFRRSCRPRFAG